MLFIKEIKPTLNTQPDTVLATEALCDFFSLRAYVHACITTVIVSTLHNFIIKSRTEANCK